MNRWTGRKARQQASEAVVVDTVGCVDGMLMVRLAQQDSLQRLHDPSPDFQFQTESKQVNPRRDPPLSKNRIVATGPGFALLGMPCDV